MYMKNWTVGVPDRKTVSSLVFGCQVSSLTAAALAAKGYTSPESVAENLNIDELSDPFLIKDMDKAAETINSAIDNCEKICVYGDYDCDGIMSTVILTSYLTEAGADTVFYIPERSEGYGLNKNAIDKIHDDGVSLIVTVDNGISAISEAEYIYELGMRLVVTDHHQQGDSLPKAEAVVDPHRHDDESPFRHMCGAGLALKLTAALDGGDYTFAMEQFGDLAAIATVADIVSLTGENRYLVTEGMRLIDNTDRPALMALKKVSGIDNKPVDSSSIGFGLAPRINASGRFGSPRTAAELFMCEDYDEALRIATELDRLNNQRKSAENDIISEINEMIDRDPSLVRKRVIFICGKNWHHGVIGIVAARIEEQYGKPCFIASDSDGEVRGSARSFGDFSVFDALTYAKDALSKFGGHPGAGGFTINKGMTEQFGQLLEQFAAENHEPMPLFSITADSPVTAQELTFQNVEDLSKLEPYGMGNEQPLFYIENAAVTEIRGMGNGSHSMIKFKFGTSEYTAKMFRTAPEALPVAGGDICKMIVTLGINEFRGNRSIDILVKDIRPQLFEQNRYFSALRSFEAMTRGEKLPNLNFYKKMLPSQQEAALIYKSIPEKGISPERLFMKLNAPDINYAKFSSAVEAFRQLGLISVSSGGQFISKAAVTKKADLFSAPVLAFLRQVIG